jgi:hypothetical protein
VAVVTVLDRFRSPIVGAPARRSRCWWGLAALDGGLAAWMMAAGPWFDRTSALTSVVTLGGHHRIVLWSAVLALTVLLATAVRTGGFVVMNRTARTLVAIAGAVSVVALAGVVAVLALFTVVVVLIAVLGRALIR